jgi:hypothetical protein
VTVSFVQGKGANGGAASAGTIAVTLTAAVTSGNAICGMVGHDSAATLTSVTDDKSNTYNLETSVVDTTNSERVTAFSLGNITNGPSTITANISSSVGARSLIADEFSGILAASNPRDSTAHGGLWNSSPGTGANGVTSGTFTTATNGDLLYGATANDSGDDTGTLTAGTTSGSFALTGTSSLTSSNACSMLKSEWCAQTTAGAGTAATFTQSVNVSRVTFLVALKAAAASPVFALPRRVFLKR